MREEVKRSMGYRPFMRCNDPRGVVERRTLKNYSEAQKLNHVVSSEAPSTSSTTHSSILNSTNLVSKRKSKRPKGMNMIAKLIGLEDASFRCFQMIDALNFKGSHKPVSRLSCLNMDHPFIPKARAEVDQEEMLLNMRIRINPLAETHISGNPSFHDEQMLDRSPSRNLDKRAQEERKTSGRNGERKRTQKSVNHLQSFERDKSVSLKPKSSRKAKDTLINLLQSDATNTGRQQTRSSSKPIKNCPENIFEEVIAYVKNRDENGEVHGNCEMKTILLLEDSTTLAEDASQIEITDYVDDDKETQCSSGDGMPPVEEGSTQVEQEVKHMTLASSTGLSTCRKGSYKLKSLLLSSPPFLRRVEEIFSLQDVLRVKGNEIDLSDQSSRMIIECANELVELRGCECRRARLPLSSAAQSYSWLEQLVDEVCDGIEALRRFFIKEDNNSGSEDNLVVLVKGDLRGGNMVSGVWDMGWRNPGSGDEIVEFVNGMEELVLDGLIEDILVDLSL